MHLKLIAEDLPQAENRVDLRDDLPHLTWTGHAAYARAGLDRAIARLPDILPFAIEGAEIVRYHPTEAHIQGTHRMGADPATSVVSRTGETHEVPGLYALGAGTFPSCSPSNPTLTLSALALMAGRSLA